MEEHRSNSPADGGPVLPAQTWARRLQRGEPDAVEEVGRRVEKILSYGTLAIPREERDDLRQEVMTEIWQAVNRIRFDFTGGFWGFVEVVTARRGIDWLRSRRERLGLPEDLGSGASGPLRAALDKERAELAAEILSELGSRCRELITLRLRDEVSYREIARRLDSPEGALRVRFHRCIARAREILNRRSRARELHGTGDRHS